MPVGTQGTVKGLMPGQVRGTGAQVVLGNTYHLMLRPGAELVAEMGGLQAWTGWGGPMLTDSGGFQVFSLAHRLKVEEAGARFRSHLDGREVMLDPEASMRVQNQLGADLIMALDVCPPAASPTEHQVQRAKALGRASGSDPGRVAAESPLRGDDGRDARPTKRAAEHRAVVEAASERTARWLERCVKAHGRPDEQALLGIVQGGTELDLRTRSAEQVTQHDLPAYAIGGVAVGEGFEQLVRVVQHTAPLLPADRPRYLMGVGYERDIVAAVRAGVDMFDCVLPTRNGRNGNAFTTGGQIRLRNAKFARDPGPIEAGCDCEACVGFSRSYIRHLLVAGEMLGGQLVSMHNLRHFQRLMLDIRAAMTHNGWAWFERRWPVAASALGDVAGSAEVR
jgi:queuine tRNA-ribosyltransferase